MKPYFLAFLAILAVGCSKNSSTSPQAIALRYYDNSSDHKWDATVTLVDSKNLREFQQEMNGTLNFIDSLEVHAPGFVDRDSILSILRTIHRQQRTPEEFFVSLLNVLMPPVRPGSVQSESKPTFTPLGEVEEGKDTVHVLSKVSIPGETQQANRLLILSLVKEPSGWKILLPSEISNNTKGRVVRMVRLIDQMIRQSVGKKK